MQFQRTYSLRETLGVVEQHLLEIEKLNERSKIACAGLEEDLEAISRARLGCNLRPEEWQTIAHRITAVPAGCFEELATYAQAIPEKDQLAIDRERAEMAEARDLDDHFRGVL